MKITKLFIEDFQQFQNFKLDLTYPADHPTKAGKPLDKVCFIGKNGTGKTTILEVMLGLLKSTEDTFSVRKKTLSALFAEYSENKSYLFVANSNMDYSTRGYVIKEKFYREVLLQKNVLDIHKQLHTDKYFGQISDYGVPSDVTKIHIPSESANNPLLTTGLVPETNLNNALAYLKEIPNYHEISYENVAQFWNLVIYQVKHREEIRLELSEKPENQNKTLQQFRQEFEAQYPDFLHILSEEWKRILDRAGLYFDYASAKNPVQLTDNLEAYIKDKFKHEKIAYYQLSSGIRHFIFKIGYLKALFFNRQVPSAIAMIDEPENSLFPNLLYDMVDIYQSIAPNTQFFFATHSPIIAGQFEPCERIILDFDDTGKVVARKGTAPEGDDPNDVLRKDFGLESVFGRKGREQRERYLELKSLIKSTTDDTLKDQYIEELMKIGNLYHF